MATPTLGLIATGNIVPGAHALTNRGVDGYGSAEALAAQVDVILQREARLLPESKRPHSSAGCSGHAPSTPSSGPEMLDDGPQVVLSMCS